MKKIMIFGIIGLLIALSGCMGLGSPAEVSSCMTKINNKYAGNDSEMARARIPYETDLCISDKATEKNDSSLCKYIQTSTIRWQCRSELGAEGSDLVVSR